MLDNVDLRLCQHRDKMIQLFRSRRHCFPQRQTPFAHRPAQWAQKFIVSRSFFPRFFFFFQYITIYIVFLKINSAIAEI